MEIISIQTRRAPTRTQEIEISFRDTKIIDAFNIGEIKRDLMYLIETPGTHLVLNLEGVTHIANDAISIFNFLLVQAKENFCIIRFTNIATPVMKIIKQEKRQSVFNISAVSIENTHVA